MKHNFMSKNIIVFGATGPTGQLVVEQALEKGHRVTAFARSPDKLTTRHENLSVVQGDGYDASRVAEAVRGHDAVVSSLGVPYTFKSVTLYSAGATNIIAAMRASGVRRLVAITSGGAFPGRDPESPFFFERILKPLFHTLYDDMRRMEELVMESGLDWTLLRPARLTNAATSGGVRVARDKYVVSGLASTTRRDLASFAVEQVASKEFVGAGVAVASQRA